jgi:hypothetical protein
MDCFAMIFLGRRGSRKAEEYFLGDAIETGKRLATISLPPKHRPIVSIGDYFDRKTPPLVSFGGIFLAAGVIAPHLG